MKRLGTGIVCLLILLSTLTGCASMLERTYSATEPHSSKFWESEAAGTLRAENYQDVVNDLLLLVNQHKERAVLRLYDENNTLSVGELLNRAIAEVQQETPMGSYAVEYIIASHQDQHGFCEASIRIGYRRTAEQIRSVVSATSTEALYSLLKNALNEGKKELVVRISYWTPESSAQTQSAVDALRREFRIKNPWCVNYYPKDGTTGLIEFLLYPDEEDLNGSTVVGAVNTRRLEH